MIGRGGGELVPVVFVPHLERGDEETNQANFKLSIILSIMALQGTTANRTCHFTVCPLWPDRLSLWSRSEGCLDRGALSRSSNLTLKWALSLLRETHTVDVSNCWMAHLCTPALCMRPLHDTLPNTCCILHYISCERGNSQDHGNRKR
jgi:hypothetical protein